MPSIDHTTQHDVSSTSDPAPSFDTHQSDPYEQQNQTQCHLHNRMQSRRQHSQDQLDIADSADEEGKDFDYRRYYEYGKSNSGDSEDSTNEHHEHLGIKNKHPTQFRPQTRQQWLMNRHYRQLNKRTSIKDPRPWGSTRNLFGVDAIPETIPENSQRSMYSRFQRNEQPQQEECRQTHCPKHKESDSSVVSPIDEVTDQSDHVQTFFANILVPASFLIAVSFSELFNKDQFDNNRNNADDSSIQRFLQGICVVCQGFTFVLSQCVMMLASSALVRHLTANFDPFAENGYELLFREFHFEFLCVRWCFNTAIFGFLLAVGCKILHDYQLFDISSDGFEDWHLKIGIAVVLIMTALTLHLLAYLNSTLIGWDNMWGMTVDLVKVLIHRGFYDNQPMEAVSIVILGVGIIFLLWGLIPGAPI